MDMTTNNPVWDKQTPPWARKDAAEAETKAA